MFVLMGDGEMAEGQVWEAAGFAGHYSIDNLIAIADVNALGQSEHTMYRHDMGVYQRKFESEGWATAVVDGHDMAAVVAALDQARMTRGRPFAILARTEKGHGISFLNDKDHWHGKPLSPEQLEKALAELAQLGPLPPVQKDDGRSYARKSLPVPPDFPAPPPPNYTAWPNGRFARGLRDWPGKSRIGKSEGLRDRWGRQEFHLFRNA